MRNDDIIIIKNDIINTGKKLSNVPFFIFVFIRYFNNYNLIKRFFGSLDTNTVHIYKTHLWTESIPIHI